MMTIVRLAHKWVALILGIQLTLWMLSGLGMAILPHSKVAGDHRMAERAAPAPLLKAATGQIGLPATVDGAEVQQVRLRNLDGRVIFDTVTSDGSVLSDAVTGAPIIVDEELATRIALADYAGPGDVVNAQYMLETTLEVRDHLAPAWRIDFNDAERTTIYVSGRNGQILERRNHYWRAFDIFWMLHIMDYQNRASFNHPLIITAALIVLWLGLSGIALWFDSFRRSDFNLVGKWQGRGKVFPLSLTDSEGSAIKMASARPMQSLFAAMDEQGYPLPSTCGGGGTCGLCRVQIGTALPILPADRRQIPESELASGYRLACQHRVEAPLVVTLPHGLLDAKNLEGTIAATNFITPDMYELRISLPEPLDFRAGSYIQVKIKPFRWDIEQSDLPNAVKTRWEASGTGRSVGTDETVYRTYSLANAPGELGHDIILSIRLALAKPDAPGASAGIGSTYLGSLVAGDTIELRGPFGDFHVDSEANETVFIGGGAGIGPIRSMIVDRLATHGCTSRMSLWYGARTQEHIVYKDDFEKLASAHPNFSWHVALSEAPETDDWPGARGLIHDLVRDQYLASHPDIERCSFYICGPPQMLKAVLSLLKSLGVPDSRIMFDDFGN